MRFQAALLAALLLVFAGNGLAAPKTSQARKAADAQSQLRQTRVQIKALAEEQRKLESERGAATRALREADAKVASAQAALRATEAGLQTQENALHGLRDKQATLQAKLLTQRTQLAALLRSAYALGKHQQLKLLLEQDRLSDLARVLAYHRYFQRDRQQRISGLSLELQALAQLGEQISERQAELAVARDAQQAALDALAAQRSDRGKLVGSLDGKYKDRSTRLAALGRDEKTTVALLERLRKLMAQLPRPKPRPPAGKPRPGNPATPGKPAVVNAAIPTGPLKLPLAGSVLAGYGGTMPDGHRSNGLLIAGTAGAPVHAVSAGRVAYADWLKGYGLLIILDHGNGWMTLYAFNDTLLKNTGDSVAAGETISTVGSSGGQGRAALYFELRRNGQPADPRSWLKK